MADHRPQGRERQNSGSSATVHKRGEGLGTGKVGNSSHNNTGSKVPMGGGRTSGSSSGIKKGVGGVSILAIIFALIFGGKGLFTGSSSSGSTSSGTTMANVANAASGYSFGTGTSHTTYTDGSYSTADTNVDKKAREKYTTIKGNGKDEVTILVFMCGADLESSYGMATSDLTEMAYADMSDQVNIIVETGGAKQWKTSAISSSTLQRWKIGEKSLEALDKNVGSGAMTDPDTLTAFIKWGVKAYPADRYELIFWDHGGGSVTGYGYDELYPNGSMSVDEIASALKAAGTKFDFIGFDACLMANYETATALEPYADYLIASEESEPGTGWYYTDWLSTLARNTSTPTLEIGKEIVDTFISACRSQSSSESISLSVTDLAELQGTSSTVFNTFAKELKTITTSDDYQTVADARSGTKEFAASSEIDQIDLIHFCNLLNTDSSNALAKVLKSAVKYNKTCNMSNAYGLSIYFPYRNTRMISTVTKIYQNLAFDDDYTGAVKSFGTLAASGNIYSSSTQNSLFSVLNGENVSNGSSYSDNDIFSILSGGSSSSSSSSGYGYGGYGGFDLTSLLGGDSSAVDNSSLGFFSQFLGRDSIPSEDLVLSEVDGQQVLRLSEDEWSKVHDIALNVWVDDGEGYIDLGLDNVYEFNDEGDLICSYDGQWLALNGQPVSYYVSSYEEDSEGNYMIHGYIPAELNGERVKIQISMTPEGYEILGAQKIYDNGTEGKGYADIGNGDQIDLICDYYSYDGEYQDSYYLGDPITVDGELELSDISIANNTCIYTYRLTDVFCSERWTPAQSN